MYYYLFLKYNTFIEIGMNTTIIKLCEIHNNLLLISVLNALNQITSIDHEINNYIPLKKKNYKYK